MQEINRVVIIGTGNVANHLSLALYSIGIKVLQVYGRNVIKAKSLAERINASYCSKISEIDKNADAYFFCIADEAIGEVLVQTSFSDHLLLHLSGTINMNVFTGYSKNYGVFYPLQTFTTDKVVDFSNIPICIEANNDLNVSLLSQLSEKLSNDVRRINSKQRAIIHIAAIFSCYYRKNKTKLIGTKL